MTNDDRGPPMHDGTESQESHLADLLWEYMDRWNAGEALDFDAIRSEHPELAAELVSSLNSLQQWRKEDASSQDTLGTLGDYTLRRQIGRGGMGVVYEAWQGSMDRVVALKVLPGAVAADERAVGRFIREAQAAGRLNHPNVVHVHGMGVEENTPYYAMLTGQSPRTSLRS